MPELKSIFIVEIVELATRDMHVAGIAGRGSRWIAGQRHHIFVADLRNF